MNADIVQEGHWDWDWRTYESTYIPGSSTPTQLTVAATTYEITVQYDKAADFQMKKDAIANDPDCAPCDNPSPSNDWCNVPWKCMELDCTVLTIDYMAPLSERDCGTDSWGAECTWCNEYYTSASWLEYYTKLHKEPTGDATTGEIVAEMLYRHDSHGGYGMGDSHVTNTTYTIQCIETTGDATDSKASWMPKDVGSVTCVVDYPLKSRANC